MVKARVIESKRNNVQIDTKGLTTRKSKKTVSPGLVYQTFRCNALHP